jgi:hypothetical protein
MRNQPTLAYSIAGITVAIAIAVVASSTLGLAKMTGDSSQPVAALAVDGGAAPVRVQAPAGQPRVVGAAADTNPGEVEYVYVDQPTAGYDDDDHDDDEHDDDEHDDRDGRARDESKRHEREDHDDDD